MGKYVSTNIDPEKLQVQDALRQSADVSRETATKRGRGHLFKYEVFMKAKYVVVHVDPSPKLVTAFRRGDDDALGKMWECVRRNTSKHAGHLAFLAEWVDDVDSFCISFAKIMSAPEIVTALIKDIDIDVKARFA